MKKAFLALVPSFRKLRFIISFITMFTVHSTTFAQQGDIPVEVFAGHRAFTHQMYLTKYLDSASRFGYFGYLRYEAPYSDRKKSSFTGQSIFFYDVAKGVSVGGGGYITNDGFMPQLAIAYSYNAGDISFTAFGSYEPVKSPNSELFVLVSYSPPLNKSGSWRLFTQLIGSYNFSYDRDFRYNFANQYLRLGLSRKAWQFGLAADLVQVSGTGSLPTNGGLFLRRSL
ncbi:hypothetical protein IM792_17385 [Mucilaginibacter sp. JRF]|uniref:hypothetical protein n=1 Tax=Mucilaginibacter sp. JRF TaxID=2780088 RepID=UPI00187F8573|nr:hypothetical protein [Mucilaginibacter sp. JRF]MBE9586231.1 hypothetical protein [Mucilaginibacter sp. JRF]